MNKVGSLCQPDTTKSCSACCGLYNYLNSGRKELVHRLARRTAHFRTIDHDEASLRRFSQWVKASEPQEKLFQTIYNCEFVGFVDQDQRRVGCLLHPEVNKGVDLRACSFYGAEMCAAHRCQSYEKLSIEEQYGVIAAIDDWFLYGLCITDIDLVKGFFFHASRVIGERPRVSVLALPPVRHALASFLVLKITWPFRTKEKGRFGKYCFAEDEYREARIPYADIDAEPSLYDAILVSLASVFSCAEDLTRAENLLRSKIDRFVEAYYGCVETLRS